MLSLNGREMYSAIRVYGYCSHSQLTSFKWTAPTVLRYCHLQAWDKSRCSTKNFLVTSADSVVALSRGNYRNYHRNEQQYARMYLKRLYCVSVAVATGIVGYLVASDTKRAAQCQSDAGEVVYLSEQPDKVRSIEPEPKTIEEAIAESDELLQRVKVGALSSLYSLFNKKHFEQICKIRFRFCRYIFGCIDCKYIGYLKEDKVLSFL